MTLRLTIFSSICSVLLSPTLVQACSCVDWSLDVFYESSSNVFTAVITSSELNGEGDVVADFEVTEVFKGDMPFSELTMGSPNSICSMSLAVGSEFLFALTDSGWVGPCDGTRPAKRGDPPKTAPWIKILRAYKARETTDLSSPWFSEDIDGVCMLSTEFLVSEKRILGSLSLYYRYAAPKYRTYTAEELNQPGLARMELFLSGYQQPEGSFVKLRTHDNEFVARYIPKKGEMYYRAAFNLFDKDVHAFSEELLNTSRVVLSGSLEGIGSIDGAEIRTTNAGSTISDFVACVKQH